MSIASSITTAEELQAANLSERCELVRGELHMMSPGNSEHGWVIMKVAVPVGAFVMQNNLGFIFAAETGFLIARDPDTVRAPDIAFVRRDRIQGDVPRKFFPGDSASAVQEKAHDWLAAGCQELWLVDPQRKTASICTLSDGALVVEPVDQLTSPILPGFELPVAELFQ